MHQINYAIKIIGKPAKSNSSQYNTIFFSFLKKYILNQRPQGKVP